MRMDASRPRVGARALAVAMIVGGVGGLAVAQAPARADVQTVIGLAYAARVMTPLGELVPPTPPGVTGIASEGRDPAFDTGLEASLPISVPGVISLGVLEARTSGGGVGGENHLASVTSLARVAGVFVGGAIRLDAVTARCTSDGDGSRGTVQILANEAGNLFPESPAPNTTIDIAGFARIVLNEQVVVDGPGETNLQVNAVHIELLPAAGGPPTADIVLGHVECRASGPNVLVTTTTTQTRSTTTTRPTTTVAGPASSTGAAGSVSTTTTVAPPTRTPTSQPEVATTQPSRPLPRTGADLQPLGVLSALGAVLGLLLLVGSSRPVRALAGAQVAPPDRPDCDLGRGRTRA